MPAPGASKDEVKSDFQIPALAEITHVRTAARTYEFASYERHIFIPRANQKAFDDAVKAGGDPLALRLYGTDVLVLIKKDGNVRIIPVVQILEFSVEKKTTK